MNLNVDTVPFCKYQRKRLLVPLTEKPREQQDSVSLGRCVSGVGAFMCVDTAVQSNICFRTACTEPLLLLSTAVPPGSPLPPPPQPFCTGRCGVVNYSGLMTRAEAFVCFNQNQDLIALIADLFATFRLGLLPLSFRSPCLSKIDYTNCNLQV